MSNTHTSEIKFQVELDENRVPEKLLWSAEDGGVNAEEIDFHKYKSYLLVVIYSMLR